MRDAGSRYVPALGLPALTGFYDTVLALTMRERRWRPLLRDRIATHVGPRGRIVDVGAGTGTLAIALAALRPDAQVIAVDGDPEVLRLARRKAGAERVSWHRGLAGELDLEDASADAVVMSLLLHHLDPGSKRRALLDARRVLAGDGRLHVADWGRPHDLVMRAVFGIVQLSDGVARPRRRSSLPLHRRGGLPPDRALRTATHRLRQPRAARSLPTGACSEPLGSRHPVRRVESPSATSSVSPSRKASTVPSPCATWISRGRVWPGQADAHSRCRGAGRYGR